MILFHPYDRWGFSMLTREQSKLYLEYVAARFSAYSNVWWSFANEYDLMPNRIEDDWHFYAKVRMVRRYWETVCRGGYVGHGDGGELTERVRRRPYSVVLFDEVEKAHPDVMHMLLQILEEGKLTDTLGRRIDFRNTIVIMTSNIGADRIGRSNTLGFSAGSPNADAEKQNNVLLETAKRTFKPEFINRVDEILVFRRLEKEDLEKIVRLELDKLVRRMANQGRKLQYSDELAAFLTEKGFQPEYGARPLRRAVERSVEDPLAEMILSGKLGDSIFADVKNNEIVFTKTKRKTK